MISEIIKFQLKEKGLRDNSNHIVLLKTQAFNNEDNKVAFKYKH